MTDPRAPTDSPCDLLPITAEIVHEIRSRTEWQRTVKIDSALLAKLCDAVKFPINSLDHWNLRRWSAMFADQGFVDAADDMIEAADYIEQIAAEPGAAPPVLSVLDPRDEAIIGLYEKYRVTRTDGKSAPGSKHAYCEYFVLDLTHDPHAYAAIDAYARSCNDDYPALANDLWERAKEIANRDRTK